MKRLMICLLAVAPLAACQSKTTSPSNDSTSNPAASTTDTGGADTSTNSGGGTATATGPPTEVKVQVASWDEIQKFLQSHPRKIVVADVWSTSCIPCMRELPHLFELQSKYPEDMVAVTINIDYVGLADEPVEQAQAKSLEFLKKQSDPQATHFVSSTPDEDVLKALNIPSVPAVLVFDRQGKRVRTFGLEGEEFNYDAKVTPYVKGLLEGNPTAGGTP